MLRFVIRVAIFSALIFGLGAGIGRAQTSDIVLYASDVSTLRGNWSRIASTTGAGGQLLTSSDYGWATTDSPQASPSDYFEASFNAPAGTAYHVWLRLRAGGDSKWNDSVWVQFSDATDQNGSAIYRIQTTSGLGLNLERCSGCGVSGWGWMDKSYWLSQPAILKFTAAGSHTIRVQTREDGVQVDQIVLSPVNYISTAPGASWGDATIVPKSVTTPTQPPAPAPTPIGSTPFWGTPMPIPGTIAAQDFDNGGQGLAYYDTTSTNEGGAYRPTGVDLAASNDGGNCIGWIAPGEWVSYTVNVAAAGTYQAAFRVASYGTGGRFHWEMNGVDRSGPINVPNTGGWQSWTTVTVTMNLSAGAQIGRLVMDAAGSSGAIGNINSMTFTAASAPPPPPPPPPPPSGSTPFQSVLAIPGVIQAEFFDNGGEGVAYHDSTSGNSGGQYRYTDVDLEPSAGGTYDVGWTSGGEWLQYTVNVAAAGTYTVSFRVASSGQGGAFHLVMNGSTVTSGLVIPNTGGWQNWQTVSQTVTLSAGQQFARVVLDGGGGGNIDFIQFDAGAAPPPPPPPPPPPSGGGSFRMITWNIHHGFTGSNVYSLYSQAQFIVSQNPDVVALEEVQTWDEFQPTTLQNLLQAMTGQAWTVVWAPVVNVAGTEGNMILTRLPVVSSATFQMHATGDYSTLLSNRSAALAKVRVGGVDVNVVATHLDYSNTTYRTIQLQQLMSWLPNFGGPRVVGGDFNSWWGEQWITTMESQYSDTWRDITGSNENGYTVNNAVRFDYLFRAFDGANRVAPTNVFVPGSSLSDHYPVVADFYVQ